MPLGGETVIAGAYTMTYNSVALGIFEGDASLPTLDQTNRAERIENTSAYGKTLIDAIYQGVNWRMTFTCIEYKTSVIACWYPFGTLGLLGVIARRYFDLATPLVMTAVAGTPAAASPATLTATKSILAPEFNSRILFGPTLRKVPIQLVLLPFDTGGTVYGHFTQT